MLTCTGVSFFHGSNDGQKGMGLIMLILIGTVPTTYALNHAVTPRQTQDFIAVSQQTAEALNKYVTPAAVVGDPRDDVTEYIRTKEFKPNTMLAMRTLINDIGTEMALFKELAKVPNDKVRNFRNDMYLASEALRLMQKSGKPSVNPVCRGRCSHVEELQGPRRPGHAVHSIVGEGCGSDCAGTRHDGWLETHRGDRR